MRGVVVIALALAACGGGSTGILEQEVGCNWPELTRCDPSAADTCTDKCATQAWCPSYTIYEIARCSANPGPSWYTPFFFSSDGLALFPCTSRGTPCVLKLCQLGYPP